jgi:anti-sigma factor RsiW
MSWVRKRDEKTEHGYVEERLSAYLDGELTQREKGIVERHLATCQDCRWNLDTLRQTVQWVQELPSVPVPRVFTIPVSAQPARAPRRRWGVPLLQGATALVALMLVFVVAGDFFLTGSWSGLPLAAPGGSEVAPTLAAEADEALQAVVETLEVEATVQMEMRMETVVEQGAIEEAAPAATGPEAPPSEEPALAAPAAEAPALESATAEPAEPPAPAAVPPSIAERMLEARATQEAVAGESPTIVEVQTAAAKAEEELAATPAPETSGAPAPEPTVIPTQTSTPPPLPTQTAVPTVTPSPAQPLAAETPTAVARAPSEGTRAEVRTEERVEPTSAAPGDEGEAARLPRNPLIVWFGVTEISLAAVFVLLAMVTIVVMIRQRRIR